MFRKISKIINDYFNDKSAKILCINGARQVGKSYIIRECGQKYYKNYIEINLADDFLGDKIFQNVKSSESFYIALSSYYGDKLDNFDNTLVFLDEIQIYPHLLTLLKTLHLDNKYKYICSGSWYYVKILDNKNVENFYFLASY